LKQAQRGSYPRSVLDQSAADYRDAGGDGSLSDHFKRRGNRLVIDPRLKKNIVFSEHNLATDGSFNEFQAIVCRNMLGIFSDRLRQRVGRLFDESLSRFGTLALGSTERFESMYFEFRYEPVDEEVGLYQKLASCMTQTLSTAELRDRHRIER
jgi:chemotaxis protein methyltransferase CheR